MGTFLDALRIIAKTPLLPHFQVWIVGGGDRELRRLQAIIAADPVLQAWLAQGRLALWGRVDNDAMGVLLARSTALVMPSFLEQYGIVAVEAMMCGTPVIASRVGGLANLVLPGISGHHFDADDVIALASILILYLRNPAWSERLRAGTCRWARRAFVQSQVMSEYPRAYAGLPSGGDAFSQRTESSSGPDETVLPPADARLAIVIQPLSETAAGDLASAFAALRREPTWNSIGHADSVAGRINVSALVELARLVCSLQQQVWPVPVDVATRCTRLAEIMLATIAGTESPGARESACRVRSASTFREGVQELRETASADGLRWAAAWLAIETINDAIAELCTGSRSGLTRLHRFLRGASDVWADCIIP